MYIYIHICIHTFECIVRNTFPPNPYYISQVSLCGKGLGIFAWASLASRLQNLRFSFEHLQFIQGNS